MGDENKIKIITTNYMETTLKALQGEMEENKYKLPTASSSTIGGVTTTSKVTSSSGYTACPIISGVPYYKDTDTDTKVLQSDCTTSNYRPLLLGYNNSTDVTTLNTSVTNQAYVNTSIYTQPSTGTIFANTFSGKLSGNADTATKLATERTIALTGSVTGSGTFDGSGNLSIATTTNHTHSYIPLSGSTAITGNLEFSNSGTAPRGIIGTMGDSDHWRIIGGATGSDSSYLELSTADNGNEPIYVRQYSSGKFVTLKRSATLLDASGNTIIPGTLTNQDGLVSFVQNSIQVGATTDWNTLLTPGCYKVQMGSGGWSNSETYHSPNSYDTNLYGFGLLFVFRGFESDSEKRTMQMYFPHREDTANNPILIRMHNGTDTSTGWQSWHPIYKGVTKSYLGLGNVNNTSDSSKNVLSATKWTTARTFTLSGDVTGSVSVDGSENINLSTTVTDDSHNHKTLSNLYTQSSRPISANITPTGSGGLSLFKASSTMTENKPPSDSHILHSYWDHSGGYDSQMAIATRIPRLYLRGCDAGTWSDWATVLDSTNYSSYALPRSGGTLTVGGYYGLTVKRSDANGSGISYQNSDGAIGGAGFLRNGDFQIASGTNADGNIMLANTTSATFPGTVTATTFNGSLNGNANTATTLKDLTSTITELNYCDGVTSNIQTQLNDKSASSHTHGLLHSSLNVRIANTTEDSGWTMINDTYKGYILKSIRTQAETPDWIANNYGSGIAFGGDDTKGVLSVKYNTPLLKIAGGNGTHPVWWFGIQGTSGQTYNLNNFSSTSHTHSYLPLSGGDITGRLQINTSIATHESPTTQCLVINSGAAPSGTTLGLINAPGIGFHISNTAWGSMVFDGSFKFVNNTFSGYMPVYASSFNGQLNGNATSATTASTAITLTGLTSTITELNYCKGVTSDIQTQLDNRIVNNVFSASGISGTSGYIAFAQLKVTGTYANRPIEFELICRGRGTPCYLHIQFANSGETDPNITSLRYWGADFGIFAHKTDTSTWLLYHTKSESYDNVTVVRVQAASQGVTITYPGTLITDKSGLEIINATLGGNIGTASSAKTADNALKLNGYSLCKANDTDVWGKIPYIDSSGVIEVGKYIDFHTTSGNTADKDVRITASTTGLTISGTTSGTFSGSLSGNASSATTLSGLTSTINELNYCSGVTSNIQTQLNAKSNSDHTHSSIDPSTISAGYTKNSIYINTHPENSGAVIPFINNDIAYLLKRGGSAVVYYDGVKQSVDISSMFNGSPNYWAIDPTGITEVVIELTLHKTFTWTNTVYVDFGSSSWRARYVAIDVMNTNNNETEWTNKSKITNNTNGEHKIIFSHNESVGFNKIRFTFGTWNHATIFRIACLGLISFGSLGLRETFLPKDGGSVYGAITPYSNNGVDLGGSSLKWNNVYATTFTGALSGNADTATKLQTARTIQTNLSSTNSASFDGTENITLGITGTLAIINGGTGATTASGILTNLGITATSTELNYCDGVTSNIQTQLNSKATSSHTHDIYFDNGTSRSANTILAAPNGNDGGATFRKLVSADLPSHNHNLLSVKSTNTISSTTNDTTANWAAQSTSVHWYNTTGQLTDQPSQYGYLLNIAGSGADVHQIWCTQASGNMVHRGGNGSGWSGTWRTILDSSNYSSYCAPKYTYGTSALTPGTSSLATGTLYIQYE